MFDKKIFQEYGLRLKIAGEIEFYIEPPLVSEERENEFQERLLGKLAEAGLMLWSFQNEVAPNQYEVALQPREADVAIRELNELKNIISDTLKEFDAAALFKAKPYENLPGCGLHIHIGIDDANGDSVLHRTGEFGNRDGESVVMLHAIGGLCATMLVTR